MRTKKVRGLRRRRKNIDRWFEAYKHVDLELLGKHRYYCCKAKIEPWSNLFNSSSYPSNYRKQLFSNLLKIYELWHMQLESEFDNFYLSIWIFDNRFIDSQVVAAIGEKIDYYDEMWHYHEQSLKFPIQLFGHERERIDEFNWRSADDEDLFAESNFLDATVAEYYTPKDYYEEQRYYRRLLKRNTPVRIIGGENGTDQEKLFVIKRGNIWIGKSKNTTLYTAH